ncbi:MAG: Gamma-glutamyl cyclotransferase, AIG2-like [Candidatus Eremiobacteraeota bacterium]|nr:Gamma-glutamyl cyclotransferase, AIG2-like [Candidatus Eremiobacteraeota bacterium]
MKPLFAYGTLRDDAWRETLLGAHYPARPALLRGYLRVANASGYLSLRATGNPADAAAGVLIELDAIGWRIADAWEDAAVTYPADTTVAEVVLYDRIDVVADTPGGPVEATAYVCPDDAGAPVDDDRLALRADAEVAAAIASFVPRMRALRTYGAAAR